MMLLCFALEELHARSTQCNGNLDGVILKRQRFGAGRKSGMISRFPRGSSVYVIFAFIDLFSLPPVAGAEDANGPPPVRKADREDPTTDFPKAVVPFFPLTMRADFDQAIAQRAQRHPDCPLFASLPGAGAVFAPRLLVAFGEQRERYASADELQRYAGIAPVTERSGNKTWVHWRWQCPTFLRQTFVEWAAESIRHSFWARTYYQQQRDKGTSHQAAVRALAFKWIRMLFRCWQDRTPYEESVYLNALKHRGSPLLHNLVH
jgi:hypothetical protein